MNSIMEALSMGNYTSYVWSAYGIALLVLIANLYAIYSQQKKLFRKLESQVSTFLKKNHEPSS